MSKRRVYVIAKELGLDNKALVGLFHSLGVTEVRNHMSVVAPEQVERVKRHLSKGGDDKAPEERVAAKGAGVVIRRGRKRGGEESKEAEASAGGEAPTTKEVVRSSVVVRRSPNAEPRRSRPEASPATRAEAESEHSEGVATPANVEVAPAAEQAAAAPQAAATQVAATQAEAQSAAASAAAPQTRPASEPASTSDVVSGSPEPKAAPEAAANPPSEMTVAEAASAPAPASAGTEANALQAPPAQSQAEASGRGEGSAAGEVASTQAPVSEAKIAENAAAERVSDASPQTQVEADGGGAGPEPEMNAQRELAEPARAAVTVQRPAADAPDDKALVDVSSGVTSAATSDGKASAESIASSDGGVAPASNAPSAATPAPRPAQRPPAKQKPQAAAAKSNGSSESPPLRRPVSFPPPAGPAAALAAAKAAGIAPARTTPPRPGTTDSSGAPKPKTGIDVWQGRPGVPMPKAPRSAAPRRAVYDAKGGAAISGGPGPRGRSGPMSGGPRRGPGPRRGIGSMRGRTGGGPVTQERSAHKKVVKIEGSVSLQALAAKLGIKAGELLMKLMSLGMTGVNINSTLDSETAKLVGEELGWTVSDVAVSDDEAIAAAQGVEDSDEEGREPRPPVVTVMGHVDHGKTSLLDKLRKTSVASGEAGGITQHIGAYSVKTPKGRMAFLDTPGHAAFTAMRARGAQCTDIVVLVVAADDGVMPQTKEAINHAKAANCPIVVAINKIDKPDAQPERVRRELSELGLQPEEWGGDTLFVEVSAHTGDGIEDLLDTILLQGEMLDLRANPRRPASGTVIEAKLDRGRGPVATVLVTEGTLRKGEGLLVGASWGRVRAMLDENGRNLNEAGPSTPVAVIGLNEVPSAGDIVNSVPDPKKAQQIAEGRRSKERSQMSATVKISMEELARRMSQSDQKELKLILKGDVQGSIEALAAALDELSTDKVRVHTVHMGVGAVTEGDVNLAVAAGAIIVGFNVRPAGKASSLAQKEGIEIRNYSIIYDVLDDVRATMEGLLTPKLVEEAIGEAEIRKIFKLSKTGVVAGCMVTKGLVKRNALIRLMREGRSLWEGNLQSLKRFKDDAKEVREGFDCGVSLGVTDVQEGDLLAAFEMKEVRPTL